MTEALGIVGLGNMGAPIAERLRAAGHPLQVHNRTPERMEPLVAAGAGAAASPAAAVPERGIVFSIVSDDDALRDICEPPHGILANAEGVVHVSMSTIGLATAHAMQERHAAVGASYLCAPVFGRPPAAAAGALWIALSGNPEAKARVMPVLDAFTAGVQDFGEAPGAANVVKLANNFLIGAAIESMAEACALVEKHQVSRSAFISLITNGLFNCPVYHNYGEQIAVQRYEPAGFRLELGLKDIMLALDAAADGAVPMPTASLVRDRILATLSAGYGGKDWAALDALAARDAGLDPDR